MEKIWIIILSVSIIILSRYALSISFDDIRTVISGRKLINEKSVMKTTMGDRYHELNNCVYHYEIKENDIVLCTFSYIDPVNLEQIDKNCYRSNSDLFIFDCNKKREFRVKPKLSYCHIFSNSWCNLIIFYMNIVKAVLTVVAMKLLKPVVLKALHSISTKLSRKKCDDCKHEYLIMHDECVKSHKSNSNHIGYYLIVSLIVLFNVYM